MNYEREQADAWFKEQVRKGSKLDGEEMFRRRMLVDELVRDGMEYEQARVEVMLERTRLLYPMRRRNDAEPEKKERVQVWITSAEITPLERDLAEKRAQIMRQNEKP